MEKPERCECARGIVAFYLSLTSVDGTLIDRAGMCRECMKETAVKRALDAVGLHP